MSPLPLLHSSEVGDTISQSDGQMHEPSSPVQVGLEELTVHEAQPLSLELQYAVADVVLDAKAVEQVPSMRLYSQPEVATHVEHIVESWQTE